MELIAREMPSEYELVDTGDWHFLLPNTNEGAVREMLAYVMAEKDRYILLKGDLIDSIPVTDKRFSLASFSDNKVTTPHEQADYVMDLLRPLAEDGRILGILIGNHEFKLWNIFNCLDYWCKELKVPWGGINAKFIHLKEGEPQWKGFFTHGNGMIGSQAKDPIQSLANMQALLKKKLQHLAGDCIYMTMGHTHKLLLVEPTIDKRVHMIDNGEKILHHYRVDTRQNSRYIDHEARWYGCSGSFFSTQSQPGTGVIPYSEIGMYEPQEHGYLKLTVGDHILQKVERVVL